MRLLVLTTRLFDVPRSGGEICTARLLDGLRHAGHDIVLAGRGDAGAASHWASAAIQLGAMESPFDEQPLLRRLGVVASALAAGEPITVHRQGARRGRSEVAQHLAACDAVVVDHLQAWPWLGGGHDKPVMLLNHNVESDHYMRQSRIATRGSGHRSTPAAARFLMRREAHGLRELELEALERAAVVACLSEGDAERLRSLARTAKREVRAQVVVLPGYPRQVPPRRRPRPMGDPPAIGLLGTWTWAPNRQGLHWLLDRVWPAIGSQARLVLAGGGLEGVSAPLGTLVLGRVADAQSFYDAVDVVAVPSLSGSGVQEKAIEAIATGLPVVATGHALRGLGAALPPNVRAASDPAGFAAACLALTRPMDGSCTSAHWGDAVLAWGAERRASYADALEQCMRHLRQGHARAGDAAVVEQYGATS